MNLYLLGTFAFAPLLLLMTPGPDLLTVIGRGIGQGRRAALVAVVGYALGDMIHTTFAVVGLSALIRASTIGFQVVKYTGAAYLIYLGIQAIRHKHQFTLHQQRDDVDLLVVLQQSIFGSVLNPKTALFFLAFLPQFVDLAKGHARIQMIVLGGVFYGSWHSNILSDCLFFRQHWAVGLCQTGNCRQSPLGNWQYLYCTWNSCSTARAKPLEAYCRVACARTCLFSSKISENGAFSTCRAHDPN